MAYNNAEGACPKENRNAASSSFSLLAHKGSESACPNVLRRREHQDSDESKEPKEIDINKCSQLSYCPFHGSQLQPRPHGEVATCSSTPLARFLIEPSHEYGVAFVRSDIRALVVEVSHGGALAGLEAYVQDNETERPLGTEHYLDIQLEVETEADLGRNAS